MYCIQKNIVQVTFETAFSFVGVSPPIWKPEIELDLGSCTPCLPLLHPLHKCLQFAPPTY